MSGHRIYTWLVQVKKNDLTPNIPCLALTQALAMMLAGLLFIVINEGNYRSRGRYCVWHIVPVCTDFCNLFDSAAVEARHVHNLCISVWTCECVDAFQSAHANISSCKSCYVTLGWFERVPSDLFKTLSFFFLLLIASHLIADSRGRESMLHKNTTPSDILVGIWLFSRRIEKSVLPCVTFICNACCCPLDFLPNVQDLSLAWENWRFQSFPSFISHFRLCSAKWWQLQPIVGVAQPLWHISCIWLAPGSWTTAMVSQRHGAKACKRMPATTISSWHQGWNE